jgi:hypothetical protein
MENQASKKPLQPNDNPLVAVTLWFRDGAALRQRFDPPVPQVVAMGAIGVFVASVGGELDFILEPLLEGDLNNENS